MNRNRTQYHYIYPIQPCTLYNLTYCTLTWNDNETDRLCEAVWTSLLSLEFNELVLGRNMIKNVI